MQSLKHHCGGMGGGEGGGGDGGGMGGGDGGGGDGGGEGGGDGGGGEGGGDGGGGEGGGGEGGGDGLSARRRPVKCMPPPTPAANVDEVEEVPAAPPLQQATSSQKKPARIRTVALRYRQADNGAECRRRRPW